METLVQSLGQGESLKKEMATHSSILAWKIPWTEEPGEGAAIALGFTKELDMTEQLKKNAWHLKKMIQMNLFLKEI